jgi:hypothetical protein
MHVIVGSNAPPIDFPPLAGDPDLGNVDVIAPTIHGQGPLLGTLVQGTLGRGTDAAAIAIRAARKPSLRIKGMPPIRGWRPLSMPGDANIVVRMFGAVTGRVVYGSLLEPKVELDRRLAAYGLASAFLVDIESQDGDSGAALVDNAGLVLGLLVGRSKSLGDVAIFTPIADVLARLSCDIPFVK